MWMTSALGTYIEKLQAEHNYSPIFPVELLPISKLEIKKWGFQYAATMVKNQGELKRYQQDAALCHTRFQSITPMEWETIRSNTEDLVIYHSNVRDKKASSVNIPSDLKLIIDNYREEYDSEVIELHTYLRSQKRSSTGCIVTMLILLPILAIAWYYFSYH